MRHINRRTFLAVGAAAAAAGVAGGCYWYRRKEHEAVPPPPGAYPGGFPNALRVPGAEPLYGILDVSGRLTFTAKSHRFPVLPGKPTPLLAYEVEHEGRTYINPTLRVKNGTTVAATFWNALEETSIIHWHGLHVDANNDGHPHDAVPGGATYRYQFKISNRAATYWYHPHPHGITGKQVHLGLAGLLIVEDEEELALQKALDIALGVTDIPLVIQDKRFDQDGALHYAPTDDEWFGGYFGNDVLVNLTPRPYFDATTRIYRFRILNGSNARAYRLVFTRGGEQLDYQVIGTDGGLLERPYRVKEAFVSPGERLDVLLDLSGVKVGDRILLRSLPFEPMHQETGDGPHKGHDMGGQGQAMPPAPAGGETGHDMSRMDSGGRGQSALPDGAAFDIMQIRITRKTRGGAMPDRLSNAREPEALEIASRRVFTLDHRKRRWRINGLRFEMQATPIVVKRGSKEIWEIRNVSASMPHPMHLHAFHYRVIERIGSPEQVRRLTVDGRGLTASDLGAKDTVLVWPDETVRLLVDFSHSFPGDQVYLFHCHNLEHEDGGMMLNLKVTA